MLYLLCIISLAFIPMTVLVIAAGIAVFTLISWAIERNAGETAVISSPQLIEFHNAYVILLIFAAHNFRGLYAYQVKVNSGGMVATVTSALLKGHLYGVLGIIYTMRGWQKRHLQSLMKNGLQKKN